jgi:hypothetical protein
MTPAKEEEEKWSSFQALIKEQLDQAFERGVQVGVMQERERVEKEKPHD